MEEINWIQEIYDESLWCGIAMNLENHKVGIYRRNFYTCGLGISLAKCVCLISNG